MAGQVGPGMKNGQYVLKLISKSKGATGLIEPAPAKDAAGKGLVNQPAVGENILCIVGSSELHGAEDRSPMLLYAVQRGSGRLWVGQLLDEFDCLPGVRGASQQEYNFLLCDIGKIEGYLQGSAGVHTGAASAGKSFAVHGLRVLQGPVPADKFEPVGGKA